MDIKKDYPYSIPAARIKAKRKELGKSQEQMALPLKISQRAYSSYEDGSARPKMEKVVLLQEMLGLEGLMAEYYPLLDQSDKKELSISNNAGKKFYNLENSGHDNVNRNELTGTSLMVKEGTFPNDKKQYQLLEKTNDNPPPAWPGIPMYDSQATAGVILKEDNTPMIAASYTLPLPPFRDCTFGTRVSGDGMSPEIRNGDYVLVKEVETIESIIFGDIYLIVTNDGMETVKYIHPGDKDGLLNLVPQNKAIPPTPMPKTNISKIYKVRGVIKGY